jgi:signal transduction histidine kinase
MASVGPLNSQQQEYIQIALRNSELLKRYINDIMVLDRLQGGKLQLQRSWCHIQQPIENAVAIGAAAIIGKRPTP